MNHIVDSRYRVIYRLFIDFACYDRPSNEVISVFKEKRMSSLLDDPAISHNEIMNK